MPRTNKGKVGSSFDEFLAEQGILEECDEQAMKQILAGQIRAAMEGDRLTKVAMAARMQTSRRALDRLLDPTERESHCTPCNGLRRPSGDSYASDSLELTGSPVRSGRAISKSLSERAQKAVETRAPWVRDILTFDCASSLQLRTCSRYLGEGSA